jgi:hypothetical protein
MEVWEGYVTAGLKKAAFINRSLKDVELSCVLYDQASWSGPLRSQAVIQAFSTESKSPPLPQRGLGTLKFNIAQSLGHPPPPFVRVSAAPNILRLSATGRLPAAPITGYIIIDS